MLVIITQVPENKSLRAPVIVMGCLIGLQVTLGMMLISITDAAKHPALMAYTIALACVGRRFHLGDGRVSPPCWSRRVVTPPAARAAD